MKRPFGRLGLYGRIILEWILHYDMGTHTGYIWLKIGADCEINLMW
jgi:hypothetical protein